VSVSLRLRPVWVRNTNAVSWPNINCRSSYGANIHIVRMWNCLNSRKYCPKEISLLLWKLLWKSWHPNIVHFLEECSPYPCLSVYILDISVPDFVNFPRHLLYWISALVNLTFQDFNWPTLGSIIIWLSYWFLFIFRIICHYVLCYSDFNVMK